MRDLERVKLECEVVLRSIMRIHAMLMIKE
jgi:hypothetical protein